ncbi:MAG: site-2 protease family protein [Alphaproteobacteria bacterium]|nr:site-2 protease family protein [Alphaproteobacteria bacterium]
MFFVRVWRWEEATLAEDPVQLERALLFTGTLMAILLAHELGHYAVARSHGFRLSLPWFLPAPILVGTLGAIIRLEEEPRTRAGLLEMGAAGPLAGLCVVGVAMTWRMVAGGADGGTELATPLLWKALSLGVHGEVLPLGTADPVGFAAWLGCLLTAMNLLPFGQLDGGHVLAALTPRWARAVGWGTTAALLLAGLVWPGWAVWAAVLHLMGARHPVQVRRDDGFPRGRPLLVAGLAVLAFALCFVPIPLG